MPNAASIRAMHLLMPSSLSVYPLCFLSFLRTISNWLLSALPLNNGRYSFVPRSVSSSAMRAINAFFHFFLAIFYTCLSFPFVFPFLCLCLFFLSCFALFAYLALLIWISCVRNSHTRPHTHTPGKHLNAHLTRLRHSTNICSAIIGQAPRQKDGESALD